MTEYKVGDTVTPKDEYTAKTIYTIKALGDLKDDGDQPAWVTCTDHPVFGIVVNLKFMQPYFEPGFFQWRGWSGKNLTGDIKWHTTNPNNGEDVPHYFRVDVDLKVNDD